MQEGQRILFAVAVSWFGRLVTILLSLLLIPILLKQMGKEEAGLWFMLGQAGAFLALMDFGISPTLTRRIAFARAESDGHLNVSLSTKAVTEIGRLMATGRVIYQYLTIGVFLIAWTTGLYFLDVLPLKSLGREKIVIAWTVMCASHALTVWASLWICVLQGTGHIGWDGLIGLVIQILVLLSQLAAVLTGGGLISLAVIASLGAVATRGAVFALIKHKHPELFVGRQQWDRSLLESMAVPAIRAWGTGLGAFMILKTDQYFIAYFKGAESIPGYFAAYQLISNLMALALTFAYSSQVFVSQHWKAARVSDVHRMVHQNVRFALIVMACGIAGLLAVGEELIGAWIGVDSFIGYPVIAVFCITMFLETQHSAIAAASRATEDEAFMWWALGAGVLNLALTWCLVEQYGLLGIAVATMLAQLLTNNWYAVYRGLARLEIPFGRYFQEVLLPVAVVFAIALAVAIVMAKLTALRGDLLVTSISGLLGSGFVCAIALWNLVVPRTRRKAVIERILGCIKGSIRTWRQ